VPIITTIPRNLRIKFISVEEESQAEFTGQIYLNFKRILLPEGSLGTTLSQEVKVYYLSPIFLQNISPGQIPVIPAKVNSTTGT
jgi:hypothetical protein